MSNEAYIQYLGVITGANAERVKGNPEAVRRLDYSKAAIETQIAQLREQVKELESEKTRLLTEYSQIEAGNLLLSNLVRQLKSQQKLGSQ